MKNLNLKISVSVLAAASTLFYLASCGKNSRGKDREIAPAASTLGLYQDKWEKLAEYLKIPLATGALSDEEIAKISNEEPDLAKRSAMINKASFAKLEKQLSTPTGFLRPENVGEYKELIEDVISRYNNESYKARCAAITGFERVDDMRLYSNQEKAADDPIHLYHLSYKAQKNHQGEAEEVTRHGYISIPEKLTGIEPLILYNHGDTIGLSKIELGRLGLMLEKAVIVAPAFPGEPLCNNHVAPSINDTKTLDCDDKGCLIKAETSIKAPWGDDAAEALAMLDCVHRAYQAKDLNPEGLGELGSLIEPMTLSNISPKALELGEKLEKIRVSKSLPVPVTGTIGSSRGGLVSLLCLVRSGAAWASIFNNYSEAIIKAKRSNPQAKEPKFDEILLSPEFRQGVAKDLGIRHSYLPPTFTSVATLAAPASVTTGSFRFVLEQIVKGDGNLSSARKLSGIKTIIEFDLFKTYREQPYSEKLMKDAAFEIISRDVAYLGPLALAALKDFDQIGENKKPLLGSMLLLHSDKDLVVPVEQTKASFNFFYGQSENPIVRHLVNASGKLNLEVDILRTEHLDFSFSKKAIFHLDEGFWQTLSELPDDFVAEESYKAYLSPTFFDPASKALNPDLKTMQKRIEDMQKVANKHLKDFNLVETNFSSENLGKLFFAKKSMRERLNSNEISKENLKVIQYLLTQHAHEGDSHFNNKIAGIKEDNNFTPSVILQDWFERKFLKEQM